MRCSILAVLAFAVFITGEASIVALAVLFLALRFFTIANLFRKRGVLLKSGLVT